MGMAEAKERIMRAAPVRKWGRGLVLAVLVLACVAGISAPAKTVLPDGVAAELRAQLSGNAESQFAGMDRAALLRFYRARDFRPAWLGNPASGAAVAALENAGADGLDPADYHAGVLEAHQLTDSAVNAARYDLTLSDGVLAYAHDLRLGRVDPSRADKMVGLARPGFDAVAALSAALAEGNFQQWLASLPPTNPQYAALKMLLARYRSAESQKWPQLPDAKKIELKTGTPSIDLLRNRLAGEGLLAANALPDDMQVLEDAVKKFQTRNGLKADGVVGRQTIAALNVTPAARAAQIKANLERWRWLPHDLGPRYIEVNAADTTLKVIDNGKVVLSSRVITGKPKTMTAIFNADVIAITVNPIWHVPVSIARKEILPKLRRNPAYLVREHIIVVDGPAGDPYGQSVNWRAVSAANLHYEFRQLPGEGNSLGLLKLEMPNPFSAYLHDTSARSLFARDERHLSHGCIRVQNIRPLAAYALYGAALDGMEKIDTAIAVGETRRIPLDKPLPVYVLYWTAMADTDGTPEFRPDVYGRDKRLIAALAGQPVNGAALDGSSYAQSGCLSVAG